MSKVKTRKKPLFIPIATLENAQVIFVNHSGGKDSQALLLLCAQLGLLDRVVVVHADLGDMEHEELKPWIDSIALGLPVHVVKPPMTFEELCRKYKRLPSGLARFCTSKLKTDPIANFIKEYMDSRGLTHGLNALGIRKTEGGDRAFTEEYEQCGAHAPTKNRNVSTWNPIREWTDAEVFNFIRERGQEPHRVYSMGWSRLSCVFCVLGRKSEHEKAAKEYPEKFAKMAQLERELGKTIRLKQVDGVKHPHFLDEYIKPEEM